MTIEKTKADAFALQDTLVTEVSAALRKQIGAAGAGADQQGGDDATPRRGRRSSGRSRR